MTDNLSDYTGTIAVIVLGLFFLIYAVGPWNWRFVRNRWAGVLIRFGRVDEDFGILGEGPVHIWWPFERLVRVPMFDLKIDIPLPDLTTAAPNPQNVTITIQVVLRFANPIKVILSVPDREPIEEFVGFVQSAARAGVQLVTMDELAGRGAGDQLGDAIAERVRKDPVLSRWGLDVISIQVKDVNFSEDFRHAQGEVVRAEGSARATRTRASAQKDAADTIGKADRRGLAAILITQEQETKVDMAKAGGLKTLVQAGSDLVDKLLKFLE